MYSLHTCPAWSWNGHDIPIKFLGEMKAGGTISLIKGKYNIVVDTGGSRDKSLIISGKFIFSSPCHHLHYVYFFQHDDGNGLCKFAIFTIDFQFFLLGLDANGLKCDDVHYVIGTHGHSDHIGNLNLFPEAICLVSHDICKGDLYFNHTFDSVIHYK